MFIACQLSSHLNQRILGPLISILKAKNTTVNGILLTYQLFQQNKMTRLNVLNYAIRVIDFNLNDNLNVEANGDSSNLQSLSSMQSPLIG